MSKYLDEHQREELLQAFLKAKDKEKCLLTKAKKFATENHHERKPPTHQIDTYLGSCRNLIASSNGAVHLEWARWKGVAPNPKKLGHSYDFVIDLMESVEYKASKKQKESLAKELNNRGGKEFLRKLHEKITSQSALEGQANRNLELETLHLRENEIENMLSPISNFSIQKGEENYEAWENVLWMKIAYIRHISEQLEKTETKGVIRTALNDIDKRIGMLAEPLLRLVRHIQINSYAERLLAHWYLNETFNSELKEEHLRLCIGLAYAQVDGFNEDGQQYVMHTHNSIFIRDKEIVFRDKYLDNQSLYKPSHPYIKKILAVGEEGDKEFKKLIKQLEKKIEGRKLTYLWNAFFTNSITIDEDFIKGQKQEFLEEDIEAWQNDWLNLYANLNVQSNLAKTWRASEYRKQK
jgi:hypothetical protein